MSAVQEFRDKLAAMLQGKGEPPIGEMATALLELDERLRRVEEPIRGPSPMAAGMSQCHNCGGPMVFQPPFLGLCPKCLQKPPGEISSPAWAVKANCCTRCGKTDSPTWHQCGPEWPVCQSCWYVAIGNQQSAKPEAAARK